MRLEGYLGMFRKSHEVWVRNFDPKGVKASQKPACDRVKNENMKVLYHQGNESNKVKPNIILGRQVFYIKFKVLLNLQRTRRTLLVPSRMDSK